MDDQDGSGAPTGIGPREAIPLLQATLAEDPENRDLLTALASAQSAAGRLRDAFATYNRLIALGDVVAETWTAIGRALFRAKDYAQAIGALEQSLAIADTGEARHHLGQALFRLGDIDGAVEQLTLAAEGTGNIASWLGLATLVPGAPSVSQQGILKVRRRFAERLAELSPEMPAPRPVRQATGGKIRVGYVSSWFRSANYMKPVWALINNHDRARFEVHLFSDAPADAVFEGYAPHEGDCRHDTGALDNGALSGFIAGQEIDVLIDLNAYSTQTRLGLFLTAPAPVTVAWFNMYATSGLPGFHYIIGDEEVVRPEDEAFFSEKVLRLPMSYLTFTTPHRTPPVVDPPCLASGRFTFGSLIAQYKMTAPVIDAWSAILSGAPESRLFLANRAMDMAENRRWVADRFAERGIDPARIEFGGSAAHYEYLQNYDRIDIALDGFPYNGGTTTMEAIWQGVPVLTFDGDRWASRTSQTLLRRTHLGEYAYGSCEEMVEAAIAMALDPETPARLAELRRDMRARLEAAPVCDAAALAREMEALLVSVVEGP